MLTKVVEPELSFLVLFTDSKSDDPLASYDVPKFQLSIAGYSQCIIFDIQTVYDTAQVVVRTAAKKGILKCANDRRWGFGSTSPQIFLQKLER